MGITENKQLVQRFYEAGNRGDMEGCLALLADDVHWTNIGSTPFSGTFPGKAELTAGLLGPLFGQLKAGIRAKIDNMVAEGDHVVVQLRGEAEMHDGRPYNNTYCHVFTIREGLVREVTEYFDTELVRNVFGD